MLFTKQREKRESLETVDRNRAPFPEHPPLVLEHRPKLILPALRPHTAKPLPVNTNWSMPVENLRRKEPTVWGQKFKWSNDLRIINRHTFRNEDFRSNQEEVMNACLSGRDVFVCMPTGGGKSLTFQLPAVLDNGVTIVVEPLISLIHDQVQYLRNVGVKVIAFDSFQSASEQQSAFASLESSTDTHLLYLTPEKLALSDKLHSNLTSLYHSKRLARLVVDEAHCISKWGRDFRADYLKLRHFREEFAGVPITVLTATATEKVREDVMAILGMRNSVVFLSCFNRPNLVFGVRPKGKNVIADMAEFIKSKHPSQSGIIYCLSRKDCERVAKELKSAYRLSAKPYHAKIKSSKRTEIHQSWMSESTKIICATIAFGLGIHKPNVRFVIHHSMPKSIENYYQEAGRAGRDGRVSDCIVYYSYADKNRQERLMAKKTDRDAGNELMKIVKYCEERFTCRRELILAHFGETFEPGRCRRTCDNCCVARVPIPHDLTMQAKLVVSVMEREARSRPRTMRQLALFLKGERAKETEKMRGEYGFAGLKDMPKEDLEALLHHLVFEDILSEVQIKQYRFTNSTVLCLGTKAEEVKYGERNVVIMFENQRKVTLPRVFIPQIPEIISVEEEPAVIISTQEGENNEGNVRKSLSADLRSELFDRLSVVRRKSTGRTGESYPDSLIEKLIAELPRNSLEAQRCGLSVPKEFLREIEYFAEVNDLGEKEDEEDSDSEDDAGSEETMSLKRRRDEEDRGQGKMCKVERK